MQLEFLAIVKAGCQISGRSFQFVGQAERFSIGGQKLRKTRGPILSQNERGRSNGSHYWIRRLN